MNNLMRVLLLMITVLSVSFFANIATSYYQEKEIIPEENLSDNQPKLFKNLELDKQINCLATNIYFEARGEPVVGQIAIAQVTLNRVNSKRFPNTICEVVYQAHKNSNGIPLRNRCQFSWYCDGKPETIIDIVSYERAMAVAKMTYDNNYIDLTEGAEYFHKTTISPNWSRVYAKTVVINNHAFYRRQI